MVSDWLGSLAEKSGCGAMGPMEASCSIASFWGLAVAISFFWQSTGKEYAIHARVQHYTKSFVVTTTSDTSYLIKPRFCKNLSSVIIVWCENPWKFL